MAVYVYSIVASTHPQRLDGLDGVGDPPGELRKVSAGKLSAIVGEATEDLRARRRDLAAHQAVQERLMADGTVLPLQFGFTTTDDDAVRTVLEDGADDFAERLRTLEGCVEYHLKAAQDEDALLRRILEESDEAHSLNEQIKSGRGGPDLPLTLGEKVAQEVQAHQGRLATSIAEALRSLTRDERQSQPTGDDFLSVSFLVTRENEDRFRTAEKKLADDLGTDVDLRVYGPLPTYSFV
ncbi:GvpL/GvpF family gas vesicle protein [Streptomyces sp. NPDC048595]|uniref:GvpL/GvpF family gas vesicle protein n=1 Tax=Streptomyces sp. NPDC048595 TaxID=3365576 RepID=UPI00371C3DDF